MFDTLSPPAKGMTDEDARKYTMRAMDKFSVSRIVDFVYKAHDSIGLSFPYRTIKRQLLTTEEYLIRNVCNISLHNVQGGCIHHYNVKPYDSIMLPLVESEYGKRIYDSNGNTELHYFYFNDGKRLSLDHSL